MKGNDKRIKEISDSKAWGYAIKMLLLCASYDYVFDNSESLREIIESDNNNYDRHKFINYDNYIVKAKDETISIYDKESNEVVWKISIW